MSKYFLVSFLLLGCGVEQSCQSTATIPTISSGPCTVEQVSPVIHSTFEYAVKQFSADALKQDVPCYQTRIIGFMQALPSDSPKNTIGYCLGYKEVRILQSFWDRASATERLTLLYHELGHCALNLDHTDGVPDIMNSYLLDDTTAEKQWDGLVNKMFERAKQ